MSLGWIFSDCTRLQGLADLDTGLAQTYHASKMWTFDAVNDTGSALYQKSSNVRVDILIWIWNSENNHTLLDAFQFTVIHSE